MYIMEAKQGTYNIGQRILKNTKSPITLYNYKNKIEIKNGTADELVVIYL